MQETSPLNEGAGPCPPTANAIPPAAASPQPAAAAAEPSPAKKAAAQVLVQLRRLAEIAWKFIADVVRYYWGMRELLWEFVAGFAPNLMAESVRMREVRLAPYESHVLADFDSTGWKATVPGRCVVCGEPTSNPPANEERSIDDASRAFWVPAGTWLAGAALGIALWNRWCLILALPLGPVLGYVLRNKVSVRLRLVRCTEHAARTNIPQVLAWGNTLVLRFGHKLVRKVFLYGEPMGTTVPQPEAMAADLPGAGEPVPAHSAPETIPLADSPVPEDATIRHERPAVYESEDDHSSPVVP
jgi:hypothetical protein